MLRRPASEVLVVEFSKDAGTSHGIAFEDRGMWPFPDLLCLRQMHVAVSRVDRDSKAAEKIEPGMEILSINGAEALKAWHCDSAIRKAGGIVEELCHRKRLTATNSLFQPRKQTGGLGW